MKNSYLVKEKITVFLYILDQIRSQSVCRLVTPSVYAGFQTWG